MIFGSAFAAADRKRFWKQIKVIWKKFLTLTLSLLIAIDRPEEKNVLRLWYAEWNYINFTFYEFEGKGRNKKESVINFEWLRDFDKRPRKKCLSNHPHGTYVEGRHNRSMFLHTIHKKFFSAEFLLSEKIFSKFYLRHSSESSWVGN